MGRQSASSARCSSSLGPASTSTSATSLGPQLLPDGTPVRFLGEVFVLARPGVDFHVGNIPGASGGGHVKAKGTLYLSNIGMVFVAKKKPAGNFVAFDMPLLFVHREKFNQPIFHCNNISGLVEPVVPEDHNKALWSPHSFKILFKEGGCGTFVPLFFNLIASVRQYNRYQPYSSGAPQARVDPLQASQTPVDEMMRHANLRRNPSYGGGHIIPNLLKTLTSLPCISPLT